MPPLIPGGDRSAPGIASTSAAGSGKNRCRRSPGITVTRKLRVPRRTSEARSGLDAEHEQDSGTALRARATSDHWNRRTAGGGRGRTGSTRLTRSAIRSSVFTRSVFPSSRRSARYPRCAVTLTAVGHPQTRAHLLDRLVTKLQRADDLALPPPTMHSSAAFSRLDSN